MPSLPPRAVPLLLQHYIRTAHTERPFHDSLRGSWLVAPDGTLPPTLGLANRTAHHLLARLPARDVRHIRAAWQAGGLVRANGREALTGCVTVPLVPIVPGGVAVAALPLRALRDPRAVPVRTLGVGWLRLSPATPRCPLLVACSDPFGALVLQAAGVAALALDGDAPASTPWHGLLADLRALRPGRLRVLCAETASGQRAAATWRTLAAAVALDADTRTLPAGCTVRDLAHVEGPAAVTALLGLTSAPARPPRPTPAPDAVTHAVPHAVPQRAPARRRPAWPWGDASGDLGPALTAFLDHRRSVGRRADECARAARQLAPFWGWCRRGAVASLRALRPRDLAAFQAVRDAADGTAGARARRVATLRGFLRWAQATGRTRHDLAGALVRVRRPAAVPPRVLSAAAIERTLSAIPVRRAGGLRDRAMLEVLYATGIRRGELAGLDVVDVHAAAGVLRVRRGKGGTARLVPLSPRAAAWVQRYLDTARPRHLQDLREPALFLSRRGRRLAPKAITGRMHACWAAAGLPQAGSCHVVRHSVATLMHDGGADIRDLQALLGHAVLTSTQLYTRVSMQRLQEVHRRTHPAMAGGSPSAA